MEGPTGAYFSNDINQPPIEYRVLINDVYVKTLEFTGPILNKYISLTHRSGKIFMFNISDYLEHTNVINIPLEAFK